MEYLEALLLERVEPFITSSVVEGDTYILPNGVMLDLTGFKNGREGFYNWLKWNFKSLNFSILGARDYLFNMNWLFVDTLNGIVEEPKAITQEQRKTLNFMAKYCKIKF